GHGRIAPFGGHLSVIGPDVTPRSAITSMISSTSPRELDGLLRGRSPFALIDVREAGEYNSSHIPRASPLAPPLLAVRLARAVPFTGPPVVLCDDDGRRARLAAATVEQMGYRKVAVLDGGVNRWVTEGFPTEWGTNVPSKDFGEKVEVVDHVAEIEA